MSEYFQSMETGEIIKAKGKLCAHWESLAMQVKCETNARTGRPGKEYSEKTLSIIHDLTLSTAEAARLSGVARSTVKYRRKKVKDEKKRIEQEAKRANLQKRT